MPKLYAALSKEKLNLYILILSAANLPHAVIRSEEGWSLWVKEADLEKAARKIEAYHTENPEVPKEISHPSQRPPPYPFGTAILVGGLLLLTHAAMAYHQVEDVLFAKFGANADRIMSGEIYRAVTALMLHSGTVHLTGNLAGIILFGAAVCGLTGSGLGWLLILSTGIAGNLANACFYQTDHLSVGASTAIFGAVGILTVNELLRKGKSTGWKKRAWLPLAAGLALLSLLGTEGPQTDLMAHLFGFMSGLLIGALQATFIWYPPPPKYQYGCWSITTIILLSSWLQ